MPVRIKPCLDTATLHSRNAAKSLVRPRRNLHSSFFSHGNASVALPFWWHAFVTPISHMFLENATKSTSSVSPATITPGMLDFLYPPKTKVFMKKLARSAQGLARLQTGGQSSSRFYSSKPRTNNALSPHHDADLLAMQDEFEGTANNSRQESAGLEPIPSTASLATLKQHLQQLDWADARDIWSTKQNAESPENSRLRAFHAVVFGSIGDVSNYDSAWEKYKQLDDSHQTTQAKIDLANFISFSGREDDSIRLLFLTDCPEIDQGYTFWRAIVIHAFAGNIAKAGEIHEAAKRQGIQGYLGSDLLLAHAMRAKQWTVALQVSTAAFGSLGTVADKDAVQKAVQNLWGLTRHLDEFNEKAAAFIKHAYDRLDPDYFIVKAFISHLLLAVFSRVPQSTKSFEHLLQLLHTYHVDHKPTLQYALEKVVKAIKTEHMPMDTTLFTMIQSIWTVYRRHCKQGEINSPLIHDLLEVFTTYDASTAAPSTDEHALIIDILSACSENSVALPYEIMVSIMEMYSWKGHVEMVRFLSSNLQPLIGSLEEMNRNEKEHEADIDRLAALIRVHAVRGEQEEAETICSRLFELYPKASKSQRIWVELIKVYAHSRDFGRMFDIAFNRMSEAGVPPKRHTLEALLRECGWVGDVPAALALLNMARKNHIDLHPTMIRHLAIAHSRNGDEYSAEEIIAMLQEANLSDDSSRSQMRIWLSKLSAAATNKDLEAANFIYRHILASGFELHRKFFSPIVALLTSKKHTDEAARIVMEVMPERGIYAGASQYGLLVRGYFYEGKYENAIKIYDYMSSHGEASDVLANTYHHASICMINRLFPGRDQYIYTSLQKLLNENTGSTTYIRDWPTVWHRDKEDMYFYSTLELLAEVEAWEVVNHLQKWYIRLVGNKPSMGILKALMKANVLAGNHEETERLWKRSLATLSSFIRNMSKDLNRLSKLSTAGDESGPNNDPTSSLEEAISTAPSENGDSLEFDVSSEAAPPMYDVRHLISFPLIQYLYSLAQQSKFDEMISTVGGLQSLGFVVLSRAWNLYVSLLCQSAEPRHIVAAFRAAEVHFASQALDYDESLDQEGWEVARKQHTRKLRRREKNKVVYPEPRTMVILKEMTVVAEESGVTGESFDLPSLEANVSLASILAQVAPQMFVKAQNWAGHRFVRQRNSRYFLGQWRERADYAKHARRDALEYLGQKEMEARLAEYGPMELLPFTSLIPADDDDQAQADVDDISEVYPVAAKAKYVEGTLALQPTSAEVKKMIEESMKQSKTTDWFPLGVKLPDIPLLWGSSPDALAKLKQTHKQYTEPDHAEPDSTDNDARKFSVLGDERT